MTPRTPVRGSRQHSWLLEGPWTVSVTTDGSYKLVNSNGVCKRIVSPTFFS